MFKLMSKNIKTLIIVFIGFIASVLSACAPTQKIVSVGPQHAQVYSVKPGMVQTIPVGKPLFLESDLSLLEGIKLLTPARAESNSLIAPSFSLEANTVLVKSYSKDKYYYYVAKKLKKTAKEHALSALTAGIGGHRRIEALGMRQLANTNKWELFAQSDKREYIYPIASAVQWKTVQLQSADYPGHAQTLVYLGKKQGKLFFRYTALKNTLQKKNIFFAGSHSEYAEQNIEIPVSQKLLQVGDKKIQILGANNSLIQFKLSIDSSTP